MQKNKRKTKQKNKKILRRIIDNWAKRKLMTKEIRMSEIESIYKKPFVYKKYDKIYKIMRNEKDSVRMHELKCQSILNNDILQIIYFNFTDFMTIEIGMFVCQTFHKYLSFYNRKNLKIWQKFADKVSNVNEKLKFNIKQFIYFNPKIHDNNENNAFNDHTNTQKLNNLKQMRRKSHKFKRSRMQETKRTLLRGNAGLEPRVLGVSYDCIGYI